MKIVQKNKLNIVLLIGFVLLQLITYPLFSFFPSSQKEYLSQLIRKGALESSTGAFNVNIQYGDTMDKATLSSEISFSCRFTWNKFVMKNYSARILLDNSLFSEYVFFGSGDEPLSAPSMLLTNSFSTHINAKEETIMDFYEIKMMFESTDSSLDGFDNVCCISEKTAKIIIGIDNPSKTDYQDLIHNSFLQLECNGVLKKWKISNIICDGFYADTHYQKTFGDYLLAYYPYLPSYNGTCFNFDFGTSFTNNKDYITTLYERYNPMKNRYLSNNRTIKDVDFLNYLPTIDELFLKIKNENAVLRYLLSFLIICLNAIVLFLLFKNNFNFDKRFIFLLLSAVFIPYYSLFFLSNYIFSLTLFFTFASIYTNIFSFILALATSMFFIIKKTPKASIRSEYEEIII